MMKKFLALTLCLVMVLSLVACAREDKDKNNNADLPTDNQPNTAPNTNNGTTNNGTTNNGTTNNGTTNNGSNSGGTVTPDDGQTDPNAKSKARRGTVTDPYTGGNGLFDDNADGMATWEQMLDNGRVRDTDGFLWDGENASWA